MTGVRIISTLLQAASNITDLVPVAAIKAGRLPENQPLPALLVRTVSGIDRQPLKRSGHVRETARISVTVRAASYRDQRAIIKAVRTSLAGRTGDLGGGTRVAILTAGLGPDVDGPGNSYEQTQDFRVSYDEPV